MYAELSFWKTISPAFHEKKTNLRLLCSLRRAWWLRNRLGPKNPLPRGGTSQDDWLVSGDPDHPAIWMFPKMVGFPPKSSILIGFSIINHPFWGKHPYFWKHPFMSHGTYTPKKDDKRLLEHNFSGGLEDDHFPFFLWVIYRFQPLIFQGVGHLEGVPQADP